MRLGAAPRQLARGLPGLARRCLGSSQFRRPRASTLALAGRLDAASPLLDSTCPPGSRRSVTVPEVNTASRRRYGTHRCTGAPAWPGSNASMPPCAAWPPGTTGRRARSPCAGSSSGRCCPSRGRRPDRRPAATPRHCPSPVRGRVGRPGHGEQLTRCRVHLTCGLALCRNGAAWLVQQVRCRMALVSVALSVNTSIASAVGRTTSSTLRR
jgi:hypothetical protein